MPRLSRKMKDTLQTIVFLLVVIVIVVVYIVYPLNRVKVSMGRADFDGYHPDSLPPNDPTAYVEAGFLVDTIDTFRVESDGLTNLACLYLNPHVDTTTTPKGTVFLLHKDGADRDSLVSLARLFVDSGFVTVVFDQRASGRSTGRYHGDGQYEASDLAEVIRYLDLRDRIVHPVIVVGFALGADGGILAAQEEKRIDAVVAVNPYLTTRRLLDDLKKRYDMFWFPFFRTIMWWWYNIRSGYAFDYRDIDDIEPVACRTLLLIPSETEHNKELERIKELSAPELLEMGTIPESESELYLVIWRFAATATQRQSS
jgi:pimeloyl-ACP methyl ester carboxylesterase